MCLQKNNTFWKTKNYQYLYFTDSYLTENVKYKRNKIKVRFYYKYQFGVKIEKLIYLYVCTHYYNLNKGVGGKIPEVFHIVAAMRCPLVGHYYLNTITEDYEFNTIQHS